VPTTCDDPLTLEAPYGQSSDVVEHDLQTHTGGKRERERGPARTDREGTGEEPLDGAGCNPGACVCSSYRWSSMVVIENMKREGWSWRENVIFGFYAKIKYSSYICPRINCSTHID
jgi:hypothetical protein